MCSGGHPVVARRQALEHWLPPRQLCCQIPIAKALYVRAAEHHVAKDYRIDLREPGKVTSKAVARSSRRELYTFKVRPSPPADERQHPQPHSDNEGQPGAADWFVTLCRFNSKFGHYWSRDQLHDHRDTKRHD